MAQQRLYFLMRLIKFGMPSWDLSKCYCYTIESVLTGCIKPGTGKAPSTTARPSSGW
jgi:hypothetical protein